MQKRFSLSNIDFFELLYSNNDFCKQMGQTILSAGKLESALIQYISNNTSEENVKKATLGKLIGIAEKNNLLQKMIPALRVIKDQRNYITHNIHALLSDRIEETILPNSELLNSDISTYEEKVWELNENINSLTKILSDYNKNH